MNGYLMEPGIDTTALLPERTLFGSWKDGGHGPPVGATHVSPVRARHASRRTVIFVGRAVPGKMGDPTDGSFMFRFAPI